MPVGYAEALGGAKAAPTRDGGDIDPSQQLTAHRPADIPSGPFGDFPVVGGLCKTSAAGHRTALCRRPPGRERRRGAGATDILALLVGGRPRTKAAIVAALAGRHAEDDVALTLVRLAVTGRWRRRAGNTRWHRNRGRTWAEV